MYIYVHESIVIVTIPVIPSIISSAVFTRSILLSRHSIELPGNVRCIAAKGHYAMVWRLPPRLDTTFFSWAPAHSVNSVFCGHC